MFLAKDQRHGGAYLVFTWDDPRKDGYKDDVVERVELDYDLLAVHHWPEGGDRPEVCVGRAVDNPKKYKVFQYHRDLQAAGYEPVEGVALVFGSWSDYIKLNPDPEYLEKLDEEKWYARLDEYDEASRRRRRRAQEPDAPASAGRDEVAAWLAKKHFIVDNSIREVWYLPHGAPPDEIRLLELSDRLADGESDPEAIDFGLDVEGARFRLSVADVTTEQLEKVKQEPARLPPGWSLDGGTVWRRGA